MALTVGTQTKYTVGARWEVVSPITVDTSYPAGGWSLTPTQLGLPLGLVDSVRVEQDAVTAVGGTRLVYDKANEKLMAFAGNSTGTYAANLVESEIPDTTDIHTELADVRVVAVGR